MNDKTAKFSLGRLLTAPGALAVLGRHKAATAILPWRPLK